MADVILPGNSDLALALREPALLVPGEKPVGSLRVKPEWRRAPMAGICYANQLALGIGVDTLGTGGFAPAGGASVVRNNLLCATDSGSVSACAKSTNQITIDQTTPVSFLFHTPRVLDFADGGTFRYFFYNQALTWFSLRTNSSSEWACCNTTALFTKVPTIGAPLGFCFTQQGINLPWQAAFHDGAFYSGPEVLRGNANDYLSLGGREDSADRSAYAEVGLAVLWVGVEFTAEEALSLARDPYQIFEPANSSPYLLSIPGGGTALPTLSNPTLVPAGGNTYYPRVTATY